MKKRAIAMILSLGMILGNMSGLGYENNGTGTDMIGVNAVAAAATGAAATGSGSAAGATGGTVTEPSVPTNPAETEAPIPTDPTVTEPVEIKAPVAPDITEIKGGSKRIKLYWNKVTGANGYYIYYSTTKNGTYTRLKTITSGATVRYVKKSLEQNKTYYFKISSYCLSGTKKIEGSKSAAVSAKTVAVAATSKAGKKYSTKAKFKKSPAYKKFTYLKNANYTKTFAIPGMKTTNVAGFANTKMVPQGTCLAGAYLLVSAYDKSGQDESVIYVLSKSSKSYITTVVMPNKTKLNALAYDGKNIWVTQGKKVSCFSYEIISKAVADGTNFTELAAFSATYPILTTGSCMAYYNGVLWAGAYNATATTKAYGYVLTTVNGKTTLSQEYSMTIPNRTRAISFDTEGYLYITRSAKANSGVSGYMSQVRSFKPSMTTPSKNGVIKKNAVLKQTKLPPMAMGATVHGSFLYTVFAGCKYANCKYVVDRVVAEKLTKLR